MQDYHQLEIWQRSMAYVADLYQLATDMPESERFNLASQLRKAATSVPLNIAEGAACSTSGEFGRFLGYAYRSLKEVTCLELCERLYPNLSAETLSTLIDEGHQISRMTHRLVYRLSPAQSHRRSERSSHDSKLKTHNS
jgi:four helix bundle protein